MGYFTNKTNGSATSVAGQLTNVVKEALDFEKTMYDTILKEILPEVKAPYSEGEKFSGSCVALVEALIDGEYKNFSTHHQLAYPEILTERKALFNGE